MPNDSALSVATKYVAGCECGATIEVIFAASDPVEKKSAAIRSAWERHICIPEAARAARPAPKPTMLERMRDSRVFEITANGDGTFDVTDLSDGAMSDRLTAEELRRLGEEIIDVALDE
ncbi:hypothetical protein DNX69_10755 [Rhodopseudomonas palustris]|uniref:Uncharacterized protein n=2 Tax=Rhodopseudomonas palustris TaxID=1076 RepID=A0A323UXI0_RHOPL|nr:hypothetical protein DNX69_10755 [Rhodopseudomonas palustris]